MSEKSSFTFLYQALYRSLINMTITLPPSRLAPQRLAITTFFRNLLLVSHWIPP